MMVKKDASHILIAATAIFIFACPNAAQTSAPPRSDATRNQSIVHGIVIYDDTHRPLRRVSVALYDPAAKNSRHSLDTWTDGKGEFQIKDVPAGKYFVEANVPGMLRDAPDDKGESRISVTVDGNSRSEVVVRIKRGCAISGRVTYADGDPVINATIKVMRKKDDKLTPIMIDYLGVYDHVVTDERGSYRITGLAAGDYIVGAAELKWAIERTVQDRPDGTNLLNRAALPPTFYGAATSSAAATVIALQGGTEQRDVDIVLAERPVHAISGTVMLNSNSRPVDQARVSLKRKDENSTFPVDDLEDPVTNTDQDGRFTFDEVQDGTYRIIVAPPRWYSRTQDSPTSAQIGKRFIDKTIEVDVAGADLSGLTIPVSSGSRISGTVAVEGERPLPRQLLVYAIGETKSDSPPSIAVNSDGTFAIQGVAAGPVRLRISTPPENHYYTKSVSVGKTDLLLGSAMVKQDEDLNDVRILISPDVAVLSGRALGLDGKAPQSGVGVVLVPMDPDALKTNSRPYGTTNADGNFRITCAPGQYLAIVLLKNEDLALTAEALRRRYPNAPRVVLQSGENNKIELVAPNNK